MQVAVVRERDVDGKDGNVDLLAAAQDVVEVKTKEATDGLVGRLGVAAVDGVVVAAGVANLLDALDRLVAVDIDVNVVVVVVVLAGGSSGDRGDDGHEDGGGVHFDGG